MPRVVSPVVTGLSPDSESSGATSGGNRRVWTEPRVTQLPPLNELTLQSTPPIPGGGGTGGGGTTVIP